MSLNRLKQFQSMPVIEWALESPESFRGWIANTKAPEFRRFLESLNHILRKNVGEKDSQAVRGIRAHNMTMQYSEGSSDTVARTCLPPEELDREFTVLFSEFKKLIVAYDFAHAALLLAHGIVILQPFGNANKRTARACLIGINSIGTDIRPNEARLTKYFVQRPAEAAYSDELFSFSLTATANYNDAVNSIISRTLHRVWPDITLLTDTRPASDLTAWDLSGVLPSLPDLLEFEGELKLTEDKAKLLRNELHNTLSEISSKCPTQVSSLAALKVLEETSGDALRSPFVKCVAPGKYEVNVIAFVESASLDDINSFIIEARAIRRAATRHAIYSLAAAPSSLQKAA